METISDEQIAKYWGAILVAVIAAVIVVLIIRKNFPRRGKPPVAAGVQAMRFCRHKPQQKIKNPYVQSKETSQVMRGFFASYKHMTAGGNSSDILLFLGLPLLHEGFYPSAQLGAGFIGSFQNLSVIVLYLGNTRCHVSYA